jgi:hypothetical protein
MKFSNTELLIVSVQFFQQLGLNQVGLVFGIGHVVSHRPDPFTTRATKPGINQLVYLGNHLLDHRK